jgi:hypothetical protein
MRRVRREGPAAVPSTLSFLRDQEILTVRDYMERVLAEDGAFLVPPEEQNFFQHRDAPLRR